MAKLAPLLQAISGTTSHGQQCASEGPHQSTVVPVQEPHQYAPQAPKSTYDNAAPHAPAMLEFLGVSSSHPIAAVPANLQQT